MITHYRKPNFATKLVLSFITIVSAIIGSIWGGFEILDLRMESKVREGERKVLSVVSAMRDERNAMVTGIDGKFAAEIAGLKGQITSIDNKLDILIGMSKRSQSKSQRDNYVVRKGPSEEGVL